MNFWNNPLLENEYCKQNYLIEYSAEQNNENSTAIYFSSSAVYPINEEKTFISTIVNENRYEWRFNKIKRANKHIFVRDIYKCWYVSGINNELDSIEKTLEFLKKETTNSKIITVGASMGGYAAVIFGTLLNAEEIFSFCGQYNIKEHVDVSAENWSPMLFKYKDCTKRNKYFDLTSYIQNSDSPIFYFASTLSKAAGDKDNITFASNFNNIYSFKIVSKRHGIPFDLCNLRDIINKSSNELIELNKELKNRNISNFDFTYKISGLKKALLQFFRPLKTLFK